MTVREIMTPNPATCTPESGLQEVARMMVEHDTGAIPVVQNENGGRPAGIVTDRDIVTRLVAEGRNPLEARARDAMTGEVVSVAPDSSVDECARLMKERQVRRVLVVEGDRVVGIVSQADIAREGSDRRTGDVVERISQPGGRA